jgi:hypothetical protein
MDLYRKHCVPRQDGCFLLSEVTFKDFFYETGKNRVQACKNDK